jgi:ATP-dependent Lon protease
VHDGAVLPVFPVPNAVLFPGMVLPFEVGRPRSRAAMEAAHSLGADPYRDAMRLVLVVWQKAPTPADPQPSDLHLVGCIAGVLKRASNTVGGETVLLHGHERVAVVSSDPTGPHLSARISRFPPEPALTHPQRSLVEEIRERALVMARAEGVPPEGLEMLLRLREPEHVVNLVAGNVGAPVDLKARWLAAPIGERVGLLLDWLRTATASSRRA